MTQTTFQIMATPNNPNVKFDDFCEFDFVLDFEQEKIFIYFFFPVKAQELVFKNIGQYRLIDASVWYFHVFKVVTKMLFIFGFCNINFVAF